MPINQAPHSPSQLRAQAILPHFFRALLDQLTMCLHEGVLAMVFPVTVTQIWLYTCILLVSMTQTTFHHVLIHFFSFSLHIREEFF